MRLLSTRSLRWASNLAFLVLSVSAAGANADGPRLEPVSLPAPLLRQGKVDVVIEASGVEPIGDGQRLLIAHDKDPALIIVEAATGRICGPPLTSAHFPKKNVGGPKWEGMARDSEGHFYLVGAHNGKTDDERATKSVLIRFRLQDGDSPMIDDASITTWHVARSLEAVLRSEGLPPEEVAKRKVEGLTVRETTSASGKTRRELFIGLREPKDKIHVFVADISGLPAADAELELKPAFAFPADSREGQASELTSLEHAPSLGGFLVVTASEDKTNVFHGNTLWFVADGDTTKASKVATFEVAMKAEGLAILGTRQDGARTAVRLLITYDNDPHVTHIPSRMQHVTLVRESR
jgi:hypothetical protein